MRLTAYRVSYTTNAYGDRTVGTETALPCHFREITEAVTGVSNETTQSDAMAWFMPDSGVDKHDIIKFDGVYYRVERVTKARRLRDETVLFIKTELLKYGAIS